MKNNTKIIFIISVVLIGGVFLLWNLPVQTEDTSNISDTRKEKVTLFKSPNCGCCAGYAAYLENQNFQVEIIDTEDMSTIKEQFQIPHDKQSCHTAVIGDYFIEGHVPLEAIQKLLEEKPSISGIALPGMLSGSPGMSGLQLSSFKIYTIKDSRSSEFMEIE